MLYHDYRTGKRIAGLLVFPCDAEPYECSYSPGYFAANSEHVTLYTGWTDEAAVETRYGNRLDRIEVIT